MTIYPRIPDLFAWYDRTGMSPGGAIVSRMPRSC